MIEVFITDIQNKVQAESVSGSIKTENTNLNVNFDFNETDLAFPCGRTILRIEGSLVDTDETITIVNELGFKCVVLEDEICK